MDQTPSPQGRRAMERAYPTPRTPDHRLIRQHDNLRAAGGSNPASDATITIRLVTLHIRFLHILREALNRSRVTPMWPSRADPLRLDFTGARSARSAPPAGRARRTGGANHANADSRKTSESDRVIFQTVPFDEK